MAHVVVEWTANLAGEVDIAALLALIAADLRDRADGVFPVGGIRVRAHRCDEWVVGDGTLPDAAFIDLRVLMGAGRDAAFRRRFFDALFDRVRASLGDVFERRPLALSMYVDEAEGWKHNSVHRFLAQEFRR